MKIEFKKSFAKQYQKLLLKKQKKVDIALAKFQRNPFDPVLKNHRLNGEYANQRAISVSGDLRVIFEVKDGYALVIMFQVGTHSEIY